MVEIDNLPRIHVDFISSSQHSNDKLYLALIKNILRQILPGTFFDLCGKKRDTPKEIVDYLYSLIPLITSKHSAEYPSNISFFVMYKYRPDAFKFFFEMISRWLIPGKRLNVLLFYAVDFIFPDLSGDVYTICEVSIHPSSNEELDEIQRNLPIIESELSMGVLSAYHARRILEIKGLSNDEKTAMIQEYIAFMIARRPREFSNDLFTDMQHVLVMCRDDFKSARTVRHLSRIICIQYLLRGFLRDALKSASEKRHLFLKIFKAKVRKSAEPPKYVLGMIVAVNFLREKEIFDETHLIKAISNYIPSARAVENSFFFNRRGNEPICTLYLEIVKADGTNFTGEEMQLLRRELPADLEGRIEHLVHPVFMPRNEEEIMRNILTLGQQIKYLRDVPQLLITFDEQTHHMLHFTVAIVRVARPESLPIQEMFKKADTFLEYTNDRCKTIGYIRRKYRKEATVFRAKVPKEAFLRRDHSVDLYKARQAVVSEISNVIGEVRDYNGGMISKQNELLNRVRELLKDHRKYNDFILENFFFSLNPVIMRTVLEPEALQKLFMMLLEAISDGVSHEERYSMKIRAEPNFVFVMVASEDRKIDDKLARDLSSMKLPSTAMASSAVTLKDTLYLGYIYRCDDPQKQRQFCIGIQHALEACESHLSPLLVK